MAWLLSGFAALLIVWLSDLFGVNRENLLYANTQMSWVVLAVAAISVGIMVFLSYARRSTTADEGGRWYVLRKTDRLRWGVLGLLLSAMAAGGATFFSAYTIEMSVNYLVHEKFSAEARITEIRNSAPHSAGGCERYATLILKEGATKVDVCVARLFNRPLLDPSLGRNFDGAVSLQARRGWAGAVVDRIERR